MRVTCLVLMICNGVAHIWYLCTAHTRLNEWSSRHSTVTHQQHRGQCKSSSSSANGTSNSSSTSSANNCSSGNNSSSNSSKQQQQATAAQ
jgi:transglutaminase/protease-like cytokinesis protein 3